MPGGWFYAHDADKVGPFSGQQLKDLAACGSLLRTDTVWKDGIETRRAGEQGPVPVRTLTGDPARTSAARVLVSTNSRRVGGGNGGGSTGCGSGCRRGGIQRWAGGAGSAHTRRHDPGSATRPQGACDRGERGDNRRPGRHVREIPKELYDLRAKRHMLYHDADRQGARP